MHGYRKVHKMGNTEDEGSVVAETHSKRTRMGPTRGSNSPRTSDVDTRHPINTATTVGTRRQANGTIGLGLLRQQNPASKEGRRCGLSGEKDIQYEFLRTVFEDKTPVFTRISDGQETMQLCRHLH